MEIKGKYEILMNQSEVEDMVRSFIWDCQDIQLESVKVVPSYNMDGTLSLKIEGDVK